MNLIKWIFLFEIFGNLWNISTATQEHCIPGCDSWNETEMYYVIQFGESSAELIRAVAGDVDEFGRPCGLGKPCPGLTFFSSEDILTKYRHPLKIAFLRILPTNEDNSREILGKTVACSPSPFTSPLSPLIMSQAPNRVILFSVVPAPTPNLAHTVSRWTPGCHLR